MRTLAAGRPGSARAHGEVEVALPPARTIDVDTSGDRRARRARALARPRRRAEGLNRPEAGNRSSRTGAGRWWPASCPAGRAARTSSGSWTARARPTRDAPDDGPEGPGARTPGNGPRPHPGRGLSSLDSIRGAARLTSCRVVLVVGFARVPHREAQLDSVAATSWSPRSPDRGPGDVLATRSRLPVCTFRHNGKTPTASVDALLSETAADRRTSPH